jgi:thioesterase domain-containing protein
MTIPQLLGRLRGLGVEVSADGDRLRINAPKGVLTPELRDELGRRKAEILAFLQIAKAWSGPASSLVPIQPRGSRRPFFAVPGHNGDVFCFIHLAKRLGDEQPFYALQPPGLDGLRPPLERVEDLAAHYVAELRAVQPEGPYLIGGYCMGGFIAFELAQQLRARGAQIGLLALFETSLFWAAPFHLRMREVVRFRARGFAEWSLHQVKTLGSLNPREQLDRIVRKARGIRNTARLRTAEKDDRYAAGAEQVQQATVSAVQRYAMRPYPGPISLFQASRRSAQLPYNRLVNWETFAAGGVDACEGPVGCHPDIMLLEPNVAFFAEHLRARLAQSGAGPMPPRGLHISLERENR